MAEFRKLLNEESRYEEFVEKGLESCSTFIMWTNESNLCWLNSSMALIAHNPTVHHLFKKFPESQVSKIRKSYFEAMFIVNDYLSSLAINQRIEIAKENLFSIQESTLRVLQPKMKYKIGEPDSAFCCLLNLLKINKNIEKYFDVTYDLIRECKNCGLTLINDQLTKPILTLSKVNFFEPENPVSLCQCPVCKCSDQKLKIVYTALPSCMIFHFENGAGKGYLLPLSFAVKTREYQLIGIMTLETSEDASLSHFVSWIRYPGKENNIRRWRASSDINSDEESKDKWLECNDLNTGTSSFASMMPLLDCNTVYMYIYQACDNNIETVTVKEPVTVKDPLLQNSKRNDIECIEISDESEAESYSKISQNNESAKCKENAKSLKIDYPNSQGKGSNINQLKSASNTKKIIKEKNESPGNISKDCFDGEIGFENTADGLKNNLNILNVKPLKSAGSTVTETSVNERDIQNFKTPKSHVEQALNKEDKVPQFKEYNQFPANEGIKKCMFPEHFEVFNDTSVDKPQQSDKRFKRKKVKANHLSDLSLPCAYVGREHNIKSKNEFRSCSEQSSDEDNSTFIDRLEQTDKSLKKRMNKPSHFSDLSSSCTYVREQNAKSRNESIGIAKDSSVIHNSDKKVSSTDKMANNNENFAKSSFGKGNNKYCKVKSQRESFEEDNPDSESNVIDNKTEYIQHYLSSNMKFTENIQEHKQKQKSDDRISINREVKRNINNSKANVTQNSLKGSPKDIKPKQCAQIHSQTDSKSQISQAVHSNSGYKYPNACKRARLSLGGTSESEISDNSKHCIDDKKVFLKSVNTAVVTLKKGKSNDDQKTFLESVKNAVASKEPKSNEIKDFNSTQIQQKKVERLLNSHCESTEKKNMQKKTLFNKAKNNEEIGHDSGVLMKKNTKENASVEDVLNIPVKEKGQDRCHSPRGLLQDSNTYFEAEKEKYTHTSNCSNMLEVKKISKTVCMNLPSISETNGTGLQNKVISQGTSETDSTKLSSKQFQNKEGTNIKSTKSQAACTKRKCKPDRKVSISPKNSLPEEPKAKKLNMSSPSGTTRTSNSTEATPSKYHICAKSDCEYKGQERPVNDIIDIVVDAIFLRHLILPKNLKAPKMP